MKESLNSLVDNIRKWDDPVLKQEASPLEASDSVEFIKTMKDTLLATKNGIGLAAPQIGELKRVILVRNNTSDNKPEVMINPEIVETGKIKHTVSEGCLSYPGFNVEIDRPNRVTVKWTTEQGGEQTKEFGGLKASVVQHEIDHLNGICLVGAAYNDLDEKQKTRARLGLPVDAAA